MKNQHKHKRKQIEIPPQLVLWAIGLCAAAMFLSSMSVSGVKEVVAVVAQESATEMKGLKTQLETDASDDSRVKSSVEKQAQKAVDRIVPIS